MSRIHQYSLSIVLLQILIHKEMQRFFFTVSLNKFQNFFAIFIVIQIFFTIHYFPFLNFLTIFSQCFFPNLSFFRLQKWFFDIFQLWFYVKSCILTIDCQIRKRNFCGSCCWLKGYWKVKKNRWMLQSSNQLLHFLAFVVNSVAPEKVSYFYLQKRNWWQTQQNLKNDACFQNH